MIRSTFTTRTDMAIEHVASRLEQLVQQKPRLSEVQTRPFVGPTGKTLFRAEIPRNGILVFDNWAPCIISATLEKGASGTKIRVVLRPNTRYLVFPMLIVAWVGLSIMNYGDYRALFFAILAAMTLGGCWHSLRGLRPLVEELIAREVGISSRTLPLITSRRQHHATAFSRVGDLVVEWIVLTAAVSAVAYQTLAFVGLSELVAKL